MTLNELAVGKTARIIKVAGTGHVRKRLLDMGLTPKTTVMLFKKAPFGDPIEIVLRDYHLTLRLDEAKLVTISML